MNSLNQKTIYQIFVRNHTKEGTFLALIKDLKRIKSLDVDILYLCPIHTIGKEGRKGTYGSPYAIYDYYSISEDLGTIEDFKMFIDAAHQLNLEVIMDMVFNHTSIDSVLTKTHPKFFDYNDKGNRYNKCGGWLDVVDLNTHRKDTQDYLLDVLKYYVDLGVDGFRFDVANFIDINLFKRLRSEIKKPLFLLAESVHTEFRNSMLKRGIYCASDAELSEYFDALYNYNSFPMLEKYLTHELSSLNPYKYRLRNDEISALHFDKRVTCLENHDLERIAHVCPNERILKNLYAYSIFNIGPSFLYAGEEYQIAHKPELFEKDPIDWTNKNEGVFAYINKLIKLKHHNLFKTYNDFKYEPCSKDMMAFSFISQNNDKIICVFNFSNHVESINIGNGQYFDLLHEKEISISKHYINVTEPLILKGYK